VCQRCCCSKKGISLVTSIRFDPVNKVIEVAMVVAVGTAAIVIPIMCQQHKHRPRRVCVGKCILRHHLLIQKGPESASTVFDTFISCTRHRNYPR